MRHKILVHIDAHHDMWWLPDARAVSIADFICQALKDEIVREVLWVVPDPSWRSSTHRKPILQHLRKITEGYPGPTAPVQVDRDQMSTQVLGTTVRACPLASLPQIREPVLLDIDVDFLVTPGVAFGLEVRWSEVPWCWPEQLVARLRQAEIHAALTTISYSTEGGYTPLKWKHLGDELSLRLGPQPERGPALRGLALVQQASVAANVKDLPTAERLYREAMPLLPASPVVRYYLAELCVDAQRLGEARELYRQAVTLDHSYRTVHASAGLLARALDRPETVERELRRMLALDP